MTIVLIFLLVVYAVGGYALEQKDKEHKKEIVKSIRHIYDEDKRQETEDITKVYNEVVLKEIWK